MIPLGTTGLPGRARRRQARALAGGAAGLVVVLWVSQGFERWTLLAVALFWTALAVDDWSGAQTLWTRGTPRTRAQGVQRAGRAMLATSVVLLLTLVPALRTQGWDRAATLVYAGTVALALGILGWGVVLLARVARR